MGNFQLPRGFKSFRRAGENDVAGQQGHVRRDEADQLQATEDHLRRGGVLAKLPVFEQLNRQAIGIDLRLDVRAKRREGVERLGPRPLALGILDRPIADVLRRRVAEDVAAGRLRRDIADAAADYDGQLRLVIGPVLLERDFDFPAVGQDRLGGFQPEEGVLGISRPDSAAWSA